MKPRECGWCSRDSAIVVGGVIDLMLDAPTHWLSGHALYELGLIAGGMVGALWPLAQLEARGRAGGLPSARAGGAAGRAGCLAGACG